MSTAGLSFARTVACANRTASAGFACETAGAPCAEAALGAGAAAGAGGAAAFGAAAACPRLPGGWSFEACRARGISIAAKRTRERSATVIEYRIGIHETGEYLRVRERSLRGSYPHAPQTCQGARSNPHSGQILSGGSRILPRIGPSGLCSVAFLHRDCSSRARPSPCLLRVTRNPVRMSSRAAINRCPIPRHCPWDGAMGRGGHIAKARRRADARGEAPYPDTPGVRGLDARDAGHRGRVGHVCFRP